MTPTITLHEGDCRVSLRRLIDQGVRVHSVVTDAPYGLVSVTKRFGKDGAAPAKHGTDGAFARASKGFMGKQWDGTGIERDPEFWRLIYEILLPGGMVFAFSGARTGHWQACAMEMAGFIMHPMHGWLYGSGMPKAHNPCPGIDKHMGVEGSESEPLPERAGRLVNQTGEYETESGWSAGNRRLGKYLPASAEAQAWDGWRYGTQTQKPALEPVYLGQKPFSEKNGVLNLLKHGVGAFNVDGCRVPTDETITTYSRGKSTASPYRPTETTVEESGRKTRQDLVDPNPHNGRWPANVLHDDSEAVRKIFPDSKGSGPARTLKRSGGNRADTEDYGFNANSPDEAALRDAGSGSAARFFNSFPTTEEDYLWAIEAGLIDDPDMVPAIYHGKATKADRAGSRHPTVKPISLMEHFIRHITPPGGTVLDPFAGSGTTGEAARRLGFDCILMEAEPDYVDFLRQRFDLPGDETPDDLAELLGGPISHPVDNDLAELLG